MRATTVVRLRRLVRKEYPSFHVSKRGISLWINEGRYTIAHFERRTRSERGCGVGQTAYLRVAYIGDDTHFKFMVQALTIILQSDTSIVSVIVPTSWTEFFTNVLQAVLVGYVLETEPLQLSASMIITWRPVTAEFLNSFI